MIAISSTAFKSGSKFLLNNNEYLLRRAIDFDNFELENLVYQNIEIWKKEDLLDCWLEGKLILKTESVELFKSKTLDDYSEKDIKIARKRFAIIKPVIKGDILPSEIKNYLKSFNGEIKKTQFYEWKKRFFESDNDIRSLIPQRKGPRVPTSNKASLKIVDDIINEYAYTGEKYSIQDIYSEMSLRMDEMNEYRSDNNKLNKLSKSTINRRIKEIVDPYREDVIKKGSVQANLIRNGSREEVNVSRPLQRVEIDWTTVDVMLIDPKDLKPKRPNLILCIDKFSGYPLGFYVTFGGVDSRAIKQCLLHSIMPKTYIKELYPLVINKWEAYGIPTTIVVDNASVNESRDVEDACNQLGIQDVQFCTIGAGHQKGAVERAFEALNSKYIHNLKGTTFSNYVEKGLYDSEGKACITLQGFIYITHIAMVDLVAHDFNNRLGYTPSEKWNMGIKSSNHELIKLPKKIEELKILLMAGTDIRRITNKGITVKNEYYQSYELMQLKVHLEKNEMSLDVRVRYDLSDMRQVYVFDIKNNQYIKAEPTGFYRKNIDVSLPVPIELLELDSKIKINRKSKVDPNLRAKAKRNIKMLEKIEAKKVKALKEGKEVNNELEDVKLIDHSLGTVLEAVVDIPVQNDEIVIIDNEIKEAVKKESNDKINNSKKKKLKEHVSSSYEIEIDEFLDWDVKFK